MSNETGALKFKDGTIRYYEYDGTRDVVLSHHYSTIKDVADNWKKGELLNCNCEGEEFVSIFTKYGDGYYIDGKACKSCNSVRPNESDFHLFERNERDDWAKELLGW